MSRLVGSFSDRVVYPLIGLAAKRLGTGPIGVVAYLHVALSAYRIGYVFVLAYVAVRSGLVPSGWVERHSVGCVAFAILMAWVYGHAPLNLAEELLNVSSGKQSCIGPVAAGHARGSTRTDLAVVLNFVGTGIWFLFAAFSVLRGDLNGTLLQLAGGCVHVANACDGVALRHPRVAGIIASSLRR